jgi:hypothetical protein
MRKKNGLWVCRYEDIPLINLGNCYLIAAKDFKQLMLIGNIFTEIKKRNVYIGRLIYPCYDDPRDYRDGEFCCFFAVRLPVKHLSKRNKLYKKTFGRVEYDVKIFRNANGDSCLLYKMRDGLNNQIRDILDKEKN